MYEPAIDPPDEPTPDPHPPSHCAEHRPRSARARRAGRTWPSPTVDHRAARSRLRLTVAFLSGAITTLAVLLVIVVIIWAVTR